MTDEEKFKCELMATTLSALIIDDSTNKISGIASVLSTDTFERQIKSAAIYTNAIVKKCVR